MGREVKRVAVDWQWPLSKVWEGYLQPEKFQEDSCPDCERGYAPHAEYLFKLWYGYVPFQPGDNGSEPFQIDHPAVRGIAERNIAMSPEFYGSGQYALIKESYRLASLWNGMWCHHLNQDDVQALVDEDRLYDFTHRWSPDKRWQPIEPPVVPTAAEVNTWSVQGFGHDSINASVVVRARCAREGFPETCATCRGHGSLEAYPGQRAEAEKWEPVEPPAGTGWQLWETVSEGSPITPVFATKDGLITHLCSADWANQSWGRGRRLTRDEAKGLVDAGWAPSVIGSPRTGVVSGMHMYGNQIRRRKRRTPDRFPKMKIRGGRRRAGFRRIRVQR